MAAVGVHRALCTVARGHAWLQSVCAGHYAQLHVAMHGCSRCAQDIMHSYTWPCMAAVGVRRPLCSCTWNLQFLKDGFLGLLRRQHESIQYPSPMFWDFLLPCRSSSRTLPISQISSSMYTGLLLVMACHCSHAYRSL